MTDYTPSAKQNPAKDATGKSLHALFATDPLDLTPEDRETIIKAFRKQRTEFQTQAKSAKKKTTSRSKKNLPDIDTLDIEL